MKCKVCEAEKDLCMFYKNDKTCKECRKEKVRSYRVLNIDKCRAYDKKRFKNDPRVRARHKRYRQTEKGKAAQKKSSKKWQDNNLAKRYANNMVNNAVRDGRLKKLPCEICGEEKSHGHHDDYAYPLSVRWLCAAHHKQWHDENGGGLNG